MRTKSSADDIINCAYSTTGQEATLAIFEANANISRGTSYTKPRTITLDTKYEGAVSIDVWNGYAINVISKRGTKRLVVGPATTLLDYDETLESVNPGTINETVFLKADGDSFHIITGTRTKDNVDFSIETTIAFSFKDDATDKWFSQKDYMARLMEFCRKRINEEIRQHTILEICDGAIFEKIFDGVVFNDYISIDEVRVHNCKVGTTSIAKMITDNRNTLVENSLNAACAEAEIAVKKRIAEAEKTIEENQLTVQEYLTQLKHENEMERLARAEVEMTKRKELEQAEKQAEADLQKIIDITHAAKLARNKKEADQNAEFAVKKAEIEKAKQDAYAEAVAKVMTAISPDLIAAMTSKANADLFTTAAESLAPYALAGGDETVADVANKIMRGTSVEGVLDQIIKNK
jgi:major vault protein